MAEARDPRERQSDRPTYATLLGKAPWRPLTFCPGRLVLPGPSGETPERLLGSSAVVHLFHVDGAADPVYVVAVEGGGLISYRKPDGRFIHTLNTTEGFARKLEQLGIRPPCSE